MNWDQSEKNEEDMEVKQGDQLEGGKRPAGLAEGGGRAENACCWIDHRWEADQGGTDDEFQVSCLSTWEEC